VRDHVQFITLGVIALTLVVAEVVLAITSSDPSELHAALLIVIGGMLGVAVPTKPPTP
jgi:hypothetical protein